MLIGGIIIALFSLVSSISPSINLYFQISLGVYLVCLGLYVPFASSELYYNTLYFRGINGILSGEFDIKGGIIIEVSSLLSIDPADIVRSFLLYPYSREIALRAGITDEIIDKYIQTQRARVSIHDLGALLQPNDFVTLKDIALFLYQTSDEFKNFLFTNGVNEAVWRASAIWVTRVRYQYKLSRRFWSRDSLGKVRGIGNELALGVAYSLRGYARELRSNEFSKALKETPYAIEMIKKIELVLLSEQSSNVLLVGEDGSGAMELVIGLSERLRKGESAASLLGKRLVLFDTERFFADQDQKEKLENTLFSLLNEAEKAGNMVIVLPDIELFIRNGTRSGSNVGKLLDRYLESPLIQFIALTSPRDYDDSLSRNEGLIRRFGIIRLEEAESESVIRVLEEASRVSEKKFRSYFTYQSLVVIAKGAEQYIVDGVMPDKALRLMNEVAQKAGSLGVKMIQHEYVQKYLSEKTGIPIGPVTTDERNLLMKLEANLHKRVIGQDDAITAIANTMRRARAGVQSEKRPIGSFLFLGSTGVGKTETAKAFANVYFGSEDRMLRFDMSEYGGGTGLVRLLGSNEQSGTLGNALKAHPYALLLLDEFEKADSDVHDLFLQILDEGVFTDGRGERVNARNTIIVATSNAGSARIYNLIQRGERPGKHQTEIINEIIEQRIFRPELINRFDATILFETLSKENERKIADLMLHALHQRLEEKGFGLTIAPEIIELLLKEGFDPEFGARPLRRAIQDVVESAIAKKILKEGLRPGDTVTLTMSDAV